MTSISSQIATMKTNTAISDAKQEKTTTTNDVTDSNMFLKLMLKQMESQDPTEPTDNSQWLAQMAQYSTLEAIVGNIDYYFWHRNIWDYSSFGNLAWFNGKICLPFCILWLFASLAIIFIGDAVTYYWLHEGEQPEYWIFGTRIWQMPIRKCHID